MSGCLVKWTTELGEYDIQYEHRTTIKAQALANFLAETVHQENEDPWKVYVDGSSSKDGIGVGVVLISPAGEEVKLAVKLDFRASNNKAEYEAVLARLRAARNVGATRVLIFSDSQLVAQQMKGMYDVKYEKLIEYAREVDRAREKFTEITFEQIPRKENEKADTLAEMAGTMGSWKTRDVVFQVELTPHTSSPAVEQEEEDWRTGIVDYLKEGKLPNNHREARKLKTRCSRYVMIGEVLYRTSFAGPLHRCLSYQEADYVLREVHEGCCGNHLGAYALARKVLLAGYSWPSVLRDAQELVMSLGNRYCGAFPTAPAQKKFLLVAVDYFSKWVEAEPLARITENEVLKFSLKNIVCRYGVPRKLISDNGRQFQGVRIQAWFKEMKIQQVFTSVAYPQSNGQVEVTNRTLVQGLKVRLGKAKVLPAGIGLESARVVFYDEDNDARRATDLDLLEEKREAASIHMEAYKNHIAQSYNRRVIQRNFQVGDLVLRKV
ncbi:uncharacterized protein [Primulina eburnea]|uniref:uncharacterized protein n=1 Tax=Primulina eburnea TaxID=1245227 RepID=UPI003C6C0637